MSPKPVSTEQLRALLHPHATESANEWQTIPEQEAEEEQPGFVRQNLAILVVASALVVALSLVGWALWNQHGRVSRELDQTKLALATANEELGRMRAGFSEASVIHDLWGLGSRFSAAGAAVCSADDDRNKLRKSTTQAIEMWSDSAVRAEIDLERMFIPALRGLQAQDFQVIGAGLPAGVVAQYRRFRREELGHVVMLDPSRIVDTDSRAAVVEFLRRAGEGQLDPSKISVLYRHDDYGDVSYRTVQGPEDASLLQVRLSDQPLAEPATIAATGFPCS